jgi:hypothetical protein
MTLLRVEVPSVQKVVNCAICYICKCSLHLQVSVTCFAAGNFLCWQLPTFTGAGAEVLVLVRELVLIGRQVLPAFLAAHGAILLQ